MMMMMNLKMTILDLLTMIMIGIAINQHLETYRKVVCVFCFHLLSLYCISSFENRRNKAARFGIAQMAN